MKALFLFTLFFVFSGVSTGIDLANAVNQKKIKVESKFSSLGKDGLMLTITNLSTQPLTINLSPGTVFIPDNDDSQTLINVEEQIIVLAPQQKKTIISNGYCINLNKHCPSDINIFKVAKTDNANLISTINFLIQNKVSQSNIQSALWAVTDGEDIGSIEALTEGDKGLRNHIATLTKRTNPWYNKTQQTVANPGMQIQRNSISLEGLLKIKPTQTIKVLVTVENDKNEVQMKMNKVLELTKDTENSFNFKVSVSNWEVGKYKVIVRKEGTKEKVAQFDFTV